METHFTGNEREILLMLLQKEENTLLIEINHTDSREFKLLLKERLNTVISLIERLKVEEPNLVF